MQPDGDEKEADGERANHQGHQQLPFHGPRVSKEQTVCLLQPADSHSDVMILFSKNKKYAEEKQTFDQIFCAAFSIVWGHLRSY